MKKQSISTLLLITLLFLGISVFGQKHTFVVYRYNQDSIKSDGYNLPLVKISESNSLGDNSIYPCKFISFNKKKGYSETIYDYTIKDTTCVIIAESFGHQTFIIPGDSMIMNIGHDIPIHSIKPYPIFWLKFITFEGQNKFIYNLFDSLTYVTGDMRFIHIPFKKTDQLGAFCDSVHKKYEQRISFLELYCDHHSIGDPYKKLAKAEIDAAYIANLLSPLDKDDNITIHDYPKPYAETLLAFRFNDPAV